MLAEGIIRSIERMSVLELVELRDQLAERWGVPVAVQLLTPDAAVVSFEAPGSPVEEQASFDLLLVDHGHNKIAVIKAVRELTDLGLREAKALVESPPGAVVCAGLARDDLEPARLKLVGAGAVVDVR